MVDFTREHFGPVKMFSRLLADKMFTDAILTTSIQPDLTIKCHRVILAAVSAPLKQKFLQRPDPQQPISVGQIPYNTLMDILKLIYEGHVRIKREEEDDFLSAMRALYIRLGDGIDQRVYQDQDHSSSATSRSLSSGVVSYRPVKPDPEYNTAEGSYFSESSSAASNRLPLVPAPQKPPTSHKPMMQHPPPSTAPSNFPRTAPFGEQQRLSRLDMFAGPEGILNLPPRSGMHVVVNASSGERAPQLSGSFGAINSDARKRTHPSPLETAFQWDWQKRPKPSQQQQRRPPQVPKPGPNGLFWLKIQLQVQTTQYAVWDKYGQHDLSSTGGSYEEGTSLYLGFQNEMGARNALRMVSEMEPETNVEVVDFVPSNIRQEIVREVKHERPPQGNWHDSNGDNGYSRFGDGQQKQQQQRPMGGNIFNMGLAAAPPPMGSNRQHQHHSGTGSNSARGGRPVGNLQLSNFPRQYKRNDFIRLLKMHQFRQFDDRGVNVVNPGQCQVDFYNSQELAKAKESLHGKTYDGCMVSADIVHAQSLF